MASLKAPLWASAQAVDELNKEEPIEQAAANKPFNPAQTVEKTLEVTEEKVVVTDEQIKDNF